MSTSAVPVGEARGNSRQKGQLNQYEIAVLYHPDLEIDLEKAENKFKKIIANNEGKISKTDNWGRRKLAYPIKKQEFAVYVFYTVVMPPKNVKKVEQTLNITDEIIRFLITRPNLKAIAKAEALKAQKAQKASTISEAEEDDKKENELSGDGL